MVRFRRDGSAGSCGRGILSRAGMASKHGKWTNAEDVDWVGRPQRMNVVCYRICGGGTTGWIAVGTTTVRKRCLIYGEA